jgi:hypothetical protein
LIMIALEADGIDFADVNRTLEEEGIAKFAQSMQSALDAIRRKRRVLAKAGD